MSDELAALRGKESLEFDGNITFEKQFESLDKFLQEVFEDFAGPVIHRGLAQGISR